MSEASTVNGVVRLFAVMLGIVALSPMPLILPSGIAVAVIGLMGGALMVQQSRRAAVPLLRRSSDGRRRG
jgi:hypothetical protein